MPPIQKACNYQTSDQCEDCEFPGSGYPDEKNGQNANGKDKPRATFDRNTVNSDSTVRLHQA